MNQMPPIEGAPSTRNAPACTFRSLREARVRHRRGPCLGRRGCVMGRPSDNGTASQEAAYCSASPDDTLPPVADTDDSGRRHSSSRLPALETALDRLAVLGQGTALATLTPQSGTQGSPKRVPPDAAVRVLGFQPADSLLDAGSPTRPMKRSGSGLTASLLGAAAAPVPPTGEKAALRDAEDAGGATSPDNRKRALAVDTLAAATASWPQHLAPDDVLTATPSAASPVAVPVRRGSWNSASFEQQAATPPSPSPLSPHWRKAGAASPRSGSGVVARPPAGSASPESGSRTLTRSLEHSFLTGSSHHGHPLCVTLSELSLHVHSCLTGRTLFKPAGGSHVRHPGFVAVLAVRAIPSSTASGATSSGASPAKRRLAFTAESCVTVRVGACTVCG